MAATGRWRERWQRLRLLSAREWRLLAESWLLCAAIAVVLPRVSFTRLIDVIEGRQPTPRSSPPVSPERMATLVESTAARVPTSTCLTKSLTLHRLLRRRDVHSELVITTKRADTGLEAHALVKLGERVLLDAGPDDYVPIFISRG